MNTVERFCHTEKFKGKASDVVAVPIGGGQKMLFFSGISAERPEGRWMHADVGGGVDIDTQTRAAWSRIKEMLSIHRGQLQDIVKVTFYSTDSRYLMNPIASIFVELFEGGNVPAATGVVVSGLAWPELLIEIDVIAVVAA